MIEAATETILTLTPRAAAEVSGLLMNAENAGKCFRVFVEQGGCSGMQCGMVFDEKRDGDFASDQPGVTVLVDTSARNICAERSATR